MAECVFLQITAGDEEANKKAAAEWEMCCDFVAAKGLEYGLSSAVAAELGPDERQTLRDILEADPVFAERGVRVEAPTDPVLGRLEIELDTGKCPKTAANFRALCTGEKGKGKESGKPLHYLNCPFHRLVPGKLVQGGDFVKGTGAAGESIYGLKFKDEKDGLKKKHTGIGDVGMANGGKDSNSSQFYITLGDQPMSSLDGKHVIFGKVREQCFDVLRKVASFAGPADGPPTAPLRITACGVLQ
eukprot:TRINITY_DN70915_c0_g1_i1.p1 TRINITY_DN70915_c0_g1~~TRINITY_DN70915_c0_g1_i1.p1  ORF type:complete len:267 (+),score=72.23 TRINITY_DN70915_c0_g1_i1:70-801(+)